MRRGVKQIRPLVAASAEEVCGTKRAVTPITHVAAVSTSRVRNSHNNHSKQTHSLELRLCHDVTLKIMAHSWVPDDIHSARVLFGGSCGWLKGPNCPHAPLRNHHLQNIVKYLARGRLGKGRYASFCVAVVFSKRCCAKLGVPSFAKQLALCAQGGYERDFDRVFARRAKNKPCVMDYDVFRRRLNKSPSRRIQSLLCFEVTVVPRFQGPRPENRCSRSLGLRETFFRVHTREGFNPRIGRGPAGAPILNQTM